MATLKTFRSFCPGLDKVEELPYFKKTSFRVKEKIFATIDLERKRDCLKLSLKNQDLFSLAEKTRVHPVPNSWGKLGWTFIEMDACIGEHINESLSLAYEEILKGKKGVAKSGTVDG